MRTIQSLVLAASLLAWAAVPAATPAEKAVEYRQGLMNVLAWNMDTLGGMARGKIPFDEQVFQRHARDLAAAASLEMLAAFPEGSKTEGSAAREEIWLDWAKLKDSHGAFRSEAAKLAEVAAGGDEAAMKAQVGAVGKACKACHDDFRE